MNLSALYAEQDMIEKHLASPEWEWQAKRAEARLKEYRNQLEVKRGEDAVKVQGQAAEVRKFLDDPRTRLTEIAEAIKKGEKADG